MSMRFLRRLTTGTGAAARLAALLALATAVGVAALLVLGPSTQTARSRVPAPGGGAPKADRDRDRVFDDLEARLERLPDGGRASVIVSLRAEPSSERVERVEDRVGDFSLDRRLSLVDAFAARVTKRQARALARQPGVEQVEPNSPVRALNDSARASLGVTKARLDAPALEGSADGDVEAYSKDDLVAAVIDSGIDAQHLDLDEGKVLGFASCLPATRTCAETAPADDNGHGTHVAASIAGEGDARADRRYQGVAPGAGLVGVKVLGPTGAGGMAEVVSGIEWAVANRARFGIEAINLSLGSEGCADGTDAASRAVDAAQAAGMVVVVAAGNAGPGTCTIGSPAAAPGALTVGAMADLGANGFHQADFSSRGPTVDGRVKPDVSAPRVDITSAARGTVNGYETANGTSSAAPLVTGVALLMRDQDPGLSTPRTKELVMDGAVDWGRGGDNRTPGTRGRDIDYGAGRLDAHAALSSAGAGLGSPPAMPAHFLREGSLAAGASVRYRLQVTDASFPLAATLIMSEVRSGAARTPDFDLELRDPSGTLVATANTFERQDELGHRPLATGAYTLTVRSASGGGAYFVDVSGGIAAPPEPIPDAPAPVVPPAPAGQVGPPAIRVLGRPFASGRRGRITVDTRALVGCPAASTVACRVAAHLRARVRAGRSARTTLLTLGRRSLAVAPARSAVVTIRLSRRGARALQRARRLRASLSVEARSAGAQPAVLRRAFALRLRR